MDLVLEHVPCDLCGADDYKVLYKKPDMLTWINNFEYPVVKCKNCGLVYVNPRPTQESMKNFYKNDYHGDREDAAHLARYDIESSFLPKLDNEKVLDIGCGPASFLKYLKRLYPNITAHGVDFFTPKVDAEGVIFHNKLLTECGFSDEEFDIITSWAVFEHSHNPGEYFSEVHRILKTNGKFVFLVTNSESLHGNKAYREDVPRHTYHFSEKTLEKYAEKFGFKMEKCVYDDRMFDGRAFGTFRYAILFAIGLSWKQIQERDYNLFQKLASKFGALLDLIVFSFHWECKLKQSGIIVVEFTKI